MEPSPQRRRLAFPFRLTTKEAVDTAIRVGAVAAALQAVLILGCMVLGLGGLAYTTDVAIYGGSAWFLLKKRSRLAAAAPLLDYAASMLFTLKTGTATLTHLHTYPNVINLIFLAAFVQAFRATWRWQAQHRETATPSIPAAETEPIRKTARPRLIMGGLLGLVLIGIVTATLPAFSEGFWRGVDKGFGEGFMKSCVATAKQQSAPPATADS
jgi:hypothetical protein